MSSNEQFFECNEPSVIFERFADETILINLDAGHYYSMDPTGAAIWDMLNRALSLERIVDVLGTRYAANREEVAESVRAYVLRMRDEGLIRARRSPPREVTNFEPVLPQAAVFSRPVLAKYDDMEEMLLLDPVHDVAEVGWPAPASGTERDSAPRIEDDDVSAWPSLDDES